MAPQERRHNEPTPEVISPIKKIFIANRGEIAVRAARACQERGISAVIPYSLEDANTLVTRIADQEGWELAAIGGTSAEESYADPDKILEEARFAGCDAIFLGYGFLSENADFIRRCEEAGMRVLAPPSSVMELAGNKIKAREIAKKVKIGRVAHIPVLEGTGNLPTFQDASHAAAQLSYPVMLKDPDTGGGMGNLVVRNQEELEKAYRQLRLRSGNREVFMERLIERAVHVEVQIAADAYGNVVSLGERDCTMQRRHQKIVEESPSPNISQHLRETIQTAAVKFAQAINYKGVGTWEFIVDMDRPGRANDPAWYFMEINPRIQVEHPVTEEQTGKDIVGLMIDIAQGKKLGFSQENIAPSGHTIEARVYAEDPRRGFAPSSGKLDMLHIPETPGVRTETGVSEGDEISPWYDPTILKTIAHGATRKEARAKLIEYLSRLELTGVPNNREFLIDLLSTPEFINATGTTTFIEQWWNNKLKERTKGLGEFINGGVLIPSPPSRRLAVELLPQDVSAPRRGSDEPVPYSQYRKEALAKRGAESYAEYGFYERDGVKYVLYHLDGHLGVDEGVIFEDACKLAHGDNENPPRPLVAIITTGGADQYQNTLALFQMDATIQALNQYPPSIYLTVAVGDDYGGGPASLGGLGQIKFIVERDTRMGFTGPYPVARSEGLEPKSTKAEDAYEVLPPGTHTPLKHFGDRTVHILVPTLSDASEKIAHLLHILNEPAIITDPTIVFKPKEAIGFSQAFDRTSRHDRPGQTFVTSIANRIGRGTLWKKGMAPRGELVFPPSLENLPVMKRLEIIQHPDRPTAADLIDPHSELFDDAFFLSNSIRVGGADQYPSIVAAIVSIDGKRLCVIGQQTQRVKDENGKEKKVYIPQKPKDWRYMQEMIELAEHLKLPILLLGDTKGADPSPDSEERDQSSYIARIAKIINLYPQPVFSTLMGWDGSGSGNIFARPVDAATALENSLAVVSDPTVQWWIMTGQWKEGKDLEPLLSQLRDATAEGRLETGQIDTITPEGRGGAHVNPKIMVRYLRSWIINSLEDLQGIPTSALLERRWERGRKVNERVTVPFKD